MCRSAGTVLLQSRDLDLKPAPLRIRFVSRQNYAQDNVRWQMHLNENLDDNGEMRHDINVSAVYRRDVGSADYLYGGGGTVSDGGCEGGLLPASTQHAAAAPGKTGLSWLR